MKAATFTQMLREYKEELRIIKNTDADYPDERLEMRRAAIVDFAYTIADSIIMDATDGSVEELDYLTFQVGKKFLDHVYHRVSSNLLKKTLNDRFKPKENEHGIRVKTKKSASVEDRGDRATGQ